MPCTDHQGESSTEGCEACALADKAAGWLAWLEHRIDELDAEAAAVDERLQATTSSRDDIAHHVEHGTLTVPLLLELIAPFLQPAVAPAVRAGSGESTDRPVPSGTTEGRGGSSSAALRRQAAGAGRPTAVAGSAPRADVAHRIDLPHPSAAVVLSALGSLLVLVAAIVFTAVSWGRLDERGRVVVMFGFLSVSAVATVVVHRRRMRWTAEALAWLTASLAAVEMAAMTAFDIVVRVDSLPVVVLLVATAVLVASVLMGAACRAGRFPLLQPWQASPVAIAIGIAAWAGGLGHEAERVWWSPLVAAVGATLVLMSRRVRQQTWWLTVAAVSWFVASMWSLVSLDGSWQRFIGAVLSAAIVLGGSSAGFPGRVGAASLPIGSVVASPLLVLVPVFQFRGGGDRAVDLALAVLGAVAVVTAWSAASERLDRRLAAGATLPLAGTALVALDEAATGAVALGLLALVAGLWAWRSGARVRSTATAVQWAAVLLWCGYVVRAGGLPAQWSAVVVTAAASATVAVTVRRRSIPADDPVVLDPAHFVAVGLAGAGVLAETGNAAALAVGASCIAVGAASLLDRRRLRVVALPTAALAASVAWSALMDSLEVEVVEAVTLPVGALLVLAGLVARQWWRRLDSWILAPGLGLAALGTMSAIPGDEGGITRWLLLLVAGAAVATAGVWRRLVAPLVIGSVAAGFAALSQLGPWAVGLPRWLTIGAVGTALLVAGARFESVRAGLRRAAGELRQLH